MGICKQNKPFPPQVTPGYIVHHSSRETKPRQEVLLWSQGMRAASLTQALLGKVTQESKAREMNKVVWRLEWRAVHCKQENLLRKVKVDANALQKWRRGKRCLRTQKRGLKSPNIILSPILCLPTEQWPQNSGSQTPINPPSLNSVGPLQSSLAWHMFLCAIYQSSRTIATWLLKNNEKNLNKEIQCILLKTHWEWNRYRYILYTVHNTQCST